MGQMTKSMPDRWDEFARVDAHRYICTGVGPDDSRKFWASGEQTIETELLPLVHEFRLEVGVALEIGCGVGRLLLPLARHFATAVGVDVSGEMILRARRNSADLGIRNIEWILASEPNAVLQQRSGLAGKVDLLYSLLVFQHIEQADLIDSYMGTIAELLAGSGVAYLHFDTRDRTALYRFRNRLPDGLLPWFWKRSIRRIRREPREIERLMRRRGLEVIRELAPGTAEHRYLLRKNPHAAREADQKP
jgi:cyclopropane fatty-acyl-phospholipid synthase-like methyltransferase